MLNYLGKEKNKSINAAEIIQLGRASQWISIRGQNEANPIMLFLHGGPGAARRYYYKRGT